MRTALIGHTGFVGSNLCHQTRFDAHFNTSNIAEMAGQSFDLVVCAGLPAAKWLANRDPDRDLANMQHLSAVLAKVFAKAFWLISTVDVYPDITAGYDEDFDPHHNDNHAYGRHRLMFEDEIRSRFDRHLIARLPGLYGPGLKKNVLFDLLNDNCLEMINPASAFQWYGLERLWRDLQQAAGAGLSVLNLMTEPVATADILGRFFPEKAVGPCAAPPCAV